MTTVAYIPFALSTTRPPSTLERFTEHFQAYYKQLYNYAYRLFGTREQAEDAVSTTYTRVLPAWLDGRCREVNIKTYLFRVVTNLFNDFCRSKKATALEHEEYAPDYRVARDISEIEGVAFFKPHLDRLPDEQREAVVLVHFFQLKAADAADVAGISVPALKSRLYRGRATLRASIGSRAAWEGH